ncbi:MAG: hypothetical protein RSF88_06055 [Lachnospiraceae bacterium]
MSTSKQLQSSHSLALKRPRINPSFDQEIYEQIITLARKSNKSASELVREWSIAGLNGRINHDNIDFIAPIIREQMRDILTPQVERLAAISAKTCIQAGAAAYLSAEAIMKFVPPNERMDFQETYEAARKKAVRFLQAKANTKEE